MQLNATEIFILTVVSGAVGWFLKQMISAKRDRGKLKGTRKEKLLSFMKKWESETESVKGIYHKAANQFVAKRHHFVAVAAQMELSYSGKVKTQFQGRVKAIRDMTPAEVEDTRLNEKGELLGVLRLLAAIKALISFVEAN